MSKIPNPKAIERPTRGPQLHDAPIVADPVVRTGVDIVVYIEPNLLGVVGLGAVHVRDGDRDQLEPVVHGALPLARGVGIVWSEHTANSPKFLDGTHLSGRTRVKEERSTEPPNLGKCFGSRSTGNIKGIVLLGKEDIKMYWYNPTTRTSERVEAPSTDEQAIQMLAGTQDSAEFIKHYCELRRSGTPIEQALVLVGHEFRLRQPEYQIALR